MNNNAGEDMGKTKLEQAKRELLLRKLKQNALPRVHQPELTQIPRINRDRKLRLSWGQERLWFLDRFEAVGSAYHMICALRLYGELSLEILQTSINAVIQRHEILRTTFHNVEGMLFQSVHEQGALTLTFSELCDTGEDTTEAEALHFGLEKLNHYFNLEQGLLIRAHVIRLRADHHILLVTMHHIISDGWSLGILMSEVAAFYAAYQQGRKLVLPALAIQYADYAEWQWQTLLGSRLQEQLAYWRETMKDAPAFLPLPSDYPRPEKQTFIGSSLSVVILSDIMAEAEKLAKSKGATLFMLMLAALQILLYRWTSQNDVIVGTVTAGRDRAEVEPLIGCFINFLPLRNHIHPEQSAEQVLNRVITSAQQIFAHQDCPFEKIVEAINPPRDPRYNPVFNVGFLLQNYEQALSFTTGEDEDYPSLKAENMDLPSTVALLDLRFVATDKEQGMTLSCEYNTELFEAETIGLLLDAYQSFFNHMMVSPLDKVSSFPLPEKLVKRAKTASAREQKKRIHVASTFTAEPVGDVLESCMQFIGQPATVYFAAYNQVLQELLNPYGLFASNNPMLNVVLLRFEDWFRFSSYESASENCAETLRRNTTELLQAIGQASQFISVPIFIVACPSSPLWEERPELQKSLAEANEMIAAYISSISNVYYLPTKELTVTYSTPEWQDAYSDQLGHVPYTDEAFAVLAMRIVRQWYAVTLPPYKVIVLDCDQTLWRGVCGEVGAEGVELDVASKALQMLMVKQHAAGVLLCLCSKNNATDVWDVFDQRLDFPLQRRHFVASRINWQAKSENIRSLAEELDLGLDSFIFIDDSPVECAEVSSFYPQVLTLQLPAERNQIPQYLQNVWAFDHIGVTNEAKGRTEQYVSQLERENFRKQSTSFNDFLAALAIEVHLAPMEDHHLERAAELTLRTNQFNLSTKHRSATEIQRLRSSGQLSCLVVHVKDRFGDYGLTGVLFYSINNTVLELDTFILSCRVLGKGVEYYVLNQLADIALLAECQEIVAPLCITKKNIPIQHFMDAVAQHCTYRHETDTTYVIEARQAKTLRYMPQENNEPIKGGGRSAPASSLSRAGQKRAKTLLDIANSLHHPRQIQALIKKKRPRKTSVSKQPNSLVTTSEKIIAGIWQELLSVDDVSRGDDFFELGGYSLLTLKLYARIKDIFDVTLPLSQIFISPVLSSFSEAVDQRTIRSNLLVPLKKQNNSETPLFLIHPAGGTIFCYASLANQLPEDWAVYAIQSPEIAGVRQADYDLDELCQQYVSIITAVNPTGSIRLGGWSLGGKIAFCMAELFEEQNRHIEWVALLDSGYATDYFDSFEEFLASIFLHLNTEDLVIDTTLLEKLRCVQQAAALEDDLNRTLQNDPKWLLHHGIDQETLAFLRTQYQIQRSHAELDRSFNPGIIKAPLHIVWASESLKAKGEEPPIDWLSLTSNKPQSSQIILQGRHTNVITKRENITAIVSILVNYEAK